MPRRSTLRPGISWWFLSLPLLFFLFLPLIALIIQADPATIFENLNTAQVRQAIWLSLKTSLTATVLTVLLGTPVAFLLARAHFPFRKTLDALIDLPMVLPPAVAGVALLIVFGRNGVLGGALESLNLQIPFTQIAVVMAQMFVAAPLFIRSAIIGIGRVEQELEEAAFLDGATNWAVLKFVTIPLAWPAFLGGAVLTWARALGEFGATIIFAGNLTGVTQTMPLAIYIGFELDLNVALTLSVILLAASFFILALLRNVIKPQT